MRRINRPAVMGPSRRTTLVTWNPLDKETNVSLSNGNLTAARVGTAAFGSARATKGIAATGSGYFEVLVGQATFVMIGLGTPAATLIDYVGSDASGWCYYSNNGNKINAAASVAYGATWIGAGAVIGVAFRKGSLWFAKNGAWQGSGDPATGAAPAFAGVGAGGALLFPMVSVQATAPQDVLTGRFKLTDMGFAPPSGIPAWESAF